MDGTRDEIKTPEEVRRRFPRPCSAEILDALPLDAAELEARKLCRWAVAEFAISLCDHLDRVDLDAWGREAYWATAGRLNRLSIDSYCRPYPSQVWHRWVFRVSANTAAPIAHVGKARRIWLGATGNPVDQPGWRLEFSMSPEELANPLLAPWLARLAVHWNSPDVRLELPPFPANFRAWDDEYVWSAAGHEAYMAGVKAGREIERERERRRLERRQP